MNNIKLDSIDFKQLLPGWMRKDATDGSLAESVSSYTHDMATSMVTLEKWTDAAVDAMSERYLDLLAQELNVTWYLYDAPIDQKRAIIKQARRTHWKIGTKWAIEQVLAIYFTSAGVLEWFDYDGESGHFKIVTEYPELYQNDETFIKVLNSVKRASQHLDGVDLCNEINTDLYKGCHMRSILYNSIICSN